MKSIPCLAAGAAAVVVLLSSPPSALAQGAPETPAAAPSVTPSTPGPRVELAADDARAAIERRVGTTSPGGLPLVETGVFSVGQWERACVAPCDIQLDPRYAYRVAGDGLVPTDAFGLPRGGDRIRVDARMGSSTGRVAGGLAMGGGAALAAAGALALLVSPILASEDVGSEGFRTGMLVGGGTALAAGAVTAAAGLFLWLANGSIAHPSTTTASVASSTSRTETP